MSSLQRSRFPSSRLLASKEVPLVDRTEEMTVLKEAVDRAIHGEGGVVFVHGEAGIGKTRLLREVGAYAQSQGVQVLHGRCLALFGMDGVPPYVLWKEIIKDYMDRCSPEQLRRVIGYYPAEVVKLVPEISLKLGSMPESFPIRPEQEQNRLFEAVSQFITNISRDAPLLVILDDLQSTDSSSLLLLHYVANGVYRAPLLLLGAYRSTEVATEHPLMPVLTELNRELILQSVSLKRMSLDDISEMIKQTLEQDDIPASFCDVVYGKTRGNPFFTEEVIKSLKEEGIIHREGSRWEIKDVSKIEFPETVKSVVKARISRLGDECQKVLTMASLIGNEFTFGTLQGVIGLEEYNLQRIMDELLKTGLLRHEVVRGEDVCSFTDTVVRDVVYEELGTFERKKLHSSVGAALEKAFAGKVDEHLGEIANHFLEAGDKGKALDYCMKAGEKAAKVYANGEAAFYLQSALRLLEEKEGRLREKACVLETLGNVKKLVGEHEACINYWDECLSCGKELCDNELLSRLHCKMANVFWENMGDVAKAKAHHEIALEILENEPETVALASLYEDIANQFSMNGETCKALPWARKALDLAERMNSDEAKARSCVALGSIMNWAGDKKGGLEYCEKGLRIALDKGFLDTAVWAYNEVAGVLPEEETGKIIENYEKGYALARKIGVIFRQSWLAASLASYYMCTGDMSKAVPMAEESVALDRKSGNVTHLSISLGRLGSAYQILGEWDKSERYYDEAFRISLGLNDFQSTILCYARAGRLYFEKEDYQKAREQYEKMLEACENAGAKYHPALMGALIHIVWTYIELGEYAKANDLAETLRDFAAETKDNYLVAQENVLKGMLLRTQKKWEESITQFESGIEQLKAIGANRWNVYVFAKMDLFEFARVYLERELQGDKEKACSLLNQASEIFQRMGARKDIEKVEATIAFIETGKAISKHKPVERVSTGYADLDKLLNGGIPANYAVVLVSPSFDERDLLIRSFLETGAKNGEVTFYMTINPCVMKTLAEEFASSFHLLVCNPQADAIVASAPNTTKLAGVENLTNISIALTSAMRRLDPAQKGPKRICIDLLSDVLLQHHAVLTRRWLTALMTELKSTGFSIMGVIDPMMHSSEELHAILGLFDGEISIYEKETQKGPKRYLKIKKMSNLKFLENELLLEKEQL